LYSQTAKGHKWHSAVGWFEEVGEGALGRGPTKPKRVIRLLKQQHGRCSLETVLKTTAFRPKSRMTGRFAWHVRPEGKERRRGGRPLRRL